MERWVGKVAVVTGASSGIGSAIVVALVDAGMIVVGLARRKDRVEELSQQVAPDAKGKLYAVKCDISSEDDIINAFAWIASELGSVAVLVNNAGISNPAAGPIIAEGNENELKQIIQTNLWGMIMCTKKAVAIMKKNNLIGGHVININSVLGHEIYDYPGLNVYPVTKFGITAISQVLRNEFNADNKQYKISNISPGLVITEMISKEVSDALPYIYAKDCADAVLFALGTPPHVQIAELTIRPVGGNQ